MIQIIITLLILPLLAQAEDVPLKASVDSASTIVAVFADAAKEPIPPLGWTFQWNAHGALGTAANYEPLSYNEKDSACGVKDASARLSPDAPSHAISRGIGYLDISAMLATGAVRAQRRILIMRHAQQFQPTTCVSGAEKIKESPQNRVVKRAALAPEPVFNWGYGCLLWQESRSGRE